MYVRLRRPNKFQAHSQQNKIFRTPKINLNTMHRSPYLKFRFKFFLLILCAILSTTAQKFVNPNNRLCWINRTMAVETNDYGEGIAYAHGWFAELFRNERFETTYVPKRQDYAIHLVNRDYKPLPYQTYILGHINETKFFKMRDLNKEEVLYVPKNTFITIERDADTFKNEGPHPNALKIRGNIQICTGCNQNFGLRLPSGLCRLTSSTPSKDVCIGEIIYNITTVKSVPPQIPSCRPAFRCTSPDSDKLYPIDVIS